MFKQVHSTADLHLVMAKKAKAQTTEMMNKGYKNPLLNGLHTLQVFVYLA